MLQNINHFDKNAALEKAKDESKKKDIKQHADKILQRLDDLQPSDTKRAIWELFQNALDLSETATIELEHLPDKVIYRHYGKVFTSDTLISLIKQVSDKPSGNNENKVGQYGTGFITTHSFGKEIEITSVLESEGFYLPIDKFKISRSAVDSESLQGAIVEAEKKVYKLYDLEPVEPQNKQVTQFSYLTETESDKNNAREAFESIGLYLPYVFALNPKLKSVQIRFLDGKYVNYQFSGKVNHNGFTELQIKKNEGLLKVFSIETTDYTVILPLNSLSESMTFPDDLSRLFLYYPLIGTEDFGINFLIHSKNFTPFTERNGIHLKSKKDQTQAKESRNRKLIKDASTSIFDFVEKYHSAVDNTLNFATIDFRTNGDKPPLNEYFTSLKQIWTDRFKEFPLVHTSKGNISPQVALFFQIELLGDKEKFDSIYDIATIFYENIPSKKVSLRWSQIVSEWQIAETSFITIETLAKKIQEKGTISEVGENRLKEFFQYIIDCGRGELFNDFALLPNIYGEFRKFSELKAPTNLNECLTGIAKVIMPEIPKGFIHPEFRFDLELASFMRNDYSKEFNQSVQKLIDGMYDEKISLTKEVFSALLDFCKIFPNTDIQSKTADLMKALLKFHESPPEFSPLLSIEDDQLNNTTARKNLIKASLFSISKKKQDWVRANEDQLWEILNYIYSFSNEEYAKILNLHFVFPNQFYELCKYENLKRDVSIPPELKSWYNEIVKPDIDIEGSLILDSFKKFLPESKKMNPSDVGKEIEEVLTENGQYQSISEHAFSSQIFSIIEYITGDEKKASWFPNLNNQKAEITLSKVTDEDTKESVFKILNLGTDQINKLGNLANEENLDAIIEAGKKALADKEKESRDFEFKHKIGKHIEQLIKQKIDHSLHLFEVDTQDDQSGQDLVVKINNQAEYFIEVKSRWNPNSSITMSSHQMNKGVKNKEQYSLVVADLANYSAQEGQDRFEITDISDIKTSIYVDNEIGKGLSFLLANNPKETSDERVSLAGDYRAYIPINRIKKGMSLDDFINYLIEKLNLKESYAQ